MRVCLVSRELAPFWGAGIGTYTAEAARAWAAGGHEIHILTAPHEPVRRFLEQRQSGSWAADPLPLVRIHTAEAPEGPRPGCAFQVHAWAVYRTLQQLHAETPFDLIEFPDYWAEGAFALAAKRTLGEFAGAVLAVRLHTPTRICRELNQEFWLDEELTVLQCAEERAIRDADAVISPSRSLLERVPAGDPRQVRAVVPYPFDGEAMRRPAPDREPAAARSDTPTVLYFGRLERRKGVRLLIEAGIRMLDSGPPVRFRFVGADTRTGPRGGSMREHLAGLIPERYREHFQFEEPRARESLAALVRECIESGGVCCFPSLWENFPNTCLEAMALGATVVGSDAGGMAEIIEDGSSGLLFGSGDAAALESQLRRALGDPDLRGRIHTAAPARVAQLCAAGRIVREMTRIVEESRDRELADPEEPSVRIHVLNAHESTDIVEEIRAADADWIVALEPDLSGEFRFCDALLRAIPRDPEAAFFTCLSASDDVLVTPIGLEKELLPVLDRAAPGIVAVRRDAVLNLPSVAALPPRTQVWGLVCALAAAGADGRVIPEPLITGTPHPLPTGPREAAMAALSARFPAPDPSVGLRILAARSLRQHQQATADRASAAHEIANLSAEIAERDRRIAALETHLASPRYKVADRVNSAMKAARVHGLAKRVARIDREEPRP